MRMVEPFDASGRPARLATFARGQLNDVDALARPMMARMADEMPVVHELSAELQVELLRWLRRLTTAGLEIIAEDRPLEGLGPMIEQMARRRRAQGVELAQVLTAYEVIQQALLDVLVGQLREHPLEAALFPQLTARLLEFQRVATAGVTAGYESAAEPPGRDRAADVQALLEIRVGRRLVTPDDHDLDRRLGLTRPLTEVTVSATVDLGLDDLVRSIARANPWGVVGRLDGRVVALTLRPPQGFPGPAGTTQLTETAEPSAVDAAVSAAGRAADVAAALGADRFTAAESAPLAAMIQMPEPERTAFTESCFGTLPQTPRGRSLLTSVSAALTYGRPGEAARALHVHRHTLDYRLGRFSAETGLDLGDPATRFRCSIGLFLIGLMPHRSESPG
jgi:hypothetical protein